MATGKARNYILSGSIAATVAMGTWYGAGLKTQHQVEQEKQVRYEATPDEQIAQLERARGALVARKLALEGKIRNLENRMREKGTLELGKNG